MSRAHTAALAAITLLFLLHPRGSEIAAASSSCAVAIAARSGFQSHFQSQSGDRTDEFIAYLQELLERGTIGDADLNRLLSDLQRNKLANPIPLGDASTDGLRLIHRDSLEEKIKSGSIDNKRLREWILKFLDHAHEVQNKRTQARTDTTLDYQKMNFAFVRPGAAYHKAKTAEFRKLRYRAKTKYYSKKILLTFPFEVTSTPVTQYQWTKVMGENPSRFSSGEYSQKVMINNEAIQMQPDNPVESVTWWSVAMFANRLSELHGLRPVYDFSSVKWLPGTRAENGTLAVDYNQSTDIDIKIFLGNKLANPLPVDPYKDDNYYKAEGYRLPTEAEQEFILKRARPPGGKNIFLSKNPPVALYDWIPENSFGTTHPVASRNPMMIGSSEIYDLYGNVREWGWNWYTSNLKGGLNPVGSPRSKSEFHRIARSGNFLGKSFKHFRGDTHRDSPEVNDRDHGLGFRLVRTLHE